MTDPVSQALMRIVEQSTDPDDLSRRVIQSYGQGTIERARHIAYEIKGKEWFLKNEISQGDVVPDRGSERVPVLRRPDLLVLAAGLALVLVVLLFPPFIVPLSEGLVTNAGFAFIFSPPIKGFLTAIVNTQLLATIIFGIVCTTWLAYFLCRKLKAK